MIYILILAIIAIWLYGMINSYTIAGIASLILFLIVVYYIFKYFTRIKP